MWNSTAKKLLKKVSKDYEKISEEFDKTRNLPWEEFEEFLRVIKNNQSLLDLGCGNGRFYEFIKDKRKVNYLGLDNSKSLLVKAKKEHPEAKFIKGNLLNIPSKKKFDVIVSIASFHHIPSKKLRKKVLIEIQKKLKKNGIFILSVWNLFQPKYKKYVWKSRIKSILSLKKYDFRDTFIPWGKTGIKRYYFAFKQNELRKLLTENNFEILKESKNNNLVFICRKK